MYGNELNNVITGNARNNWIFGGAGNDTMKGGAGDDTYVVDVAGDLVVEDLNEGYDWVVAYLGGAFTTYTLAANVEGLDAYSLGNMTLNGNPLDNEIYGFAGNDTLNGGAGVDTITGGAGKDSIDARSDSTSSTADVVVAGDGNDTVTVNTGFASVSGGAGVETLNFNYGPGGESMSMLNRDAPSISRPAGPIRTARPSASTCTRPRPTPHCATRTCPFMPAMDVRRKSRGWHWTCTI